MVIHYMYILFSQLCVVALGGKVVIEGNNTAGRNLIGASGAGGDHDGNEGASAQLTSADRYDKLNESLNDPDLFPTQASIPDDVPAQNKVDNSGPALGSGEIAGVAIGAVIVLLMVMGTAYFCWKKNCFRLNRPGPQAIPNVMEMQSTR